MHPVHVEISEPSTNSLAPRPIRLRSQARGGATTLHPQHHHHPLSTRRQLSDSRSDIHRHARIIRRTSEHSGLPLSGWASSTTMTASLMSSATSPAHQRKHMIPATCEPSALRGAFTSIFSRHGKLETMNFSIGSTMQHPISRQTRPHAMCKSSQTPRKTQIPTVSLSLSTSFRTRLTGFLCTHPPSTHTFRHSLKEHAAGKHRISSGELETFPVDMWRPQTTSSSISWARTRQASSSSVLPPPKRGKVAPGPARHKSVQEVDLRRTVDLLLSPDYPACRNSFVRRFRYSDTAHDVWYSSRFTFFQYDSGLFRCLSGHSTNPSRHQTILCHVTFDIGEASSSPWPPTIHTSRGIETLPLASRSSSASTTWHTLSLMDAISSSVLP